MAIAQIDVLPAVDETADKHLQVIESQAGTLEQRVAGLAVRSDADYQTGLAFVTEIKTTFKAAEADRVAITGPLNEALRRINAKYKAPMDRLKAAQRTIEARCGAWYAERQRKARAAEAKALAAQQAKLAAQRERADQLGVAAPLPAPVAPRIVEPAKTVKFEGGASATMKAVKRWRVVDITKVPLEYLTTNDTKIGQVVRAGVEIPGIETYDEYTTSVKGGA